MSSVNAEAEPALTAPSAQTSAALLVLIVEDDDADAYLLAHVLAQHPRVANVVRAADGYEALTLLKSGATPDLAIIDLGMPRRGGLELMEDLGKVARDFPMIVLTSSLAPSDTIGSLSRGADRVLKKPHSVDELRDLLAISLASV